MAKQTFEQYIRTEILSGLSSMRCRNDKKTPEDFAHYILENFNETKREEILKMFANESFFDSFVSAHNTLKDFESYKKKQLPEEEFLKFPSIFFKTTVKYIVIYNIILCFGEDFDNDVNDKSFRVVPNKEAVKSLTYAIRDIGANYLVPFTK